MSLRFAFRLRFHLEPGTDFENTPSETALDERGAILTDLGSASGTHPRRFSIQQGGFLSSADAELAGRLWSDALVVAGMACGRGIDLGRFALAGGFTKFALDQAKVMGLPPVRNDVHGLDVYEDVPNTTFASLSADATSTMPFEKFIAALRRSRAEDPIPPKVRLSLELLGLSRFESSARVRFLISISAIEALCYQELVTADQLAFISACIERLETAEVADAEHLRQRIMGLRRVSIGSACRSLINVHLDEAMSKRFSKIYAIRSRLIHDGDASNADFTGLAVETQTMHTQLLKSVLRSKSTGSVVLARKD